MKIKSEKLWIIDKNGFWRVFNVKSTLEFYSVNVPIYTKAQRHNYGINWSISSDTMVQERSREMRKRSDSWWSDWSICQFAMGWKNSWLVRDSFIFRIYLGTGVLGIHEFVGKSIYSPDNCARGSRPEIRGVRDRSQHRFFHQRRCHVHELKRERISMENDGWALVITLAKKSKKFWIPANSSVYKKKKKTIQTIVVNIFSPFLDSRISLNFFRRTKRGVLKNVISLCRWILFVEPSKFFNIYLWRTRVAEESVSIGLLSQGLLTASSLRLRVQWYIPSLSIPINTCTHTCIHTCVCTYINASQREVAGLQSLATLLISFLPSLGCNQHEWISTKFTHVRALGSSYRGEFVTAESKCPFLTLIRKSI